MKKFYFILTTMLFTAINMMAQVSPTSSPYYSDGMYSVSSDSTTVSNKKLVMYKPVLPPIMNKYPVVLFQPGANGIFGGTINVHTYDLYLRHLATYGVVTMVIDETTAGFPTGTTMSACLNWVKQQCRSTSGHWLANYADSTKIIVGGHSNGGVNACETLADYPNDIAGIIFFASYPNTFPAANVGSYTGKVLDLAGSEDDSSTPSSCYSGYNKFTSSDCRTWVLINGLGHGGFGDYVNTSQPVGSIGRDNATATVRHFLVSFMLGQFKNDNTAANNLFTQNLRPNTTGEFETTCSAPTENDLISFENNISVYPNPASDIVNIEFEQELNVASKIYIYSLSGQLCFSTHINDYSTRILKFDLNNLPAGMYLLKIETPDKDIKKIINKQ